jgi:hypothetical protein
MRALWAVFVVAGLLPGAAHASRGFTLSRAPYLGVACKSAAPSCDRVGLAVWLSSPARRVAACVDGQTIVLVTKAGGSGAYRSRYFWQGFFHDPYVAGLAKQQGKVSVRVRAVSAKGALFTATRTLSVAQGYG